MPLNVLVTGGAGYLGSILCEHLLQRGYAVTVLDNLLYNQHSLFHLCHHRLLRFVRGDARDEAVLAPLVRQADVLIPLAAIVGAPACERDRIGAQTTNLDAIRLLNRLRSPSQLVIYPNTNSGYGIRSGAGVCTEDTPLEPISWYGQTKVLAERELLPSANVIVFRLATVFGMSPRMRLDLLVNHFVYAAVTDGYLVLFEKDFRRNFIHVRDVADAFVHAIENSPRMVGRPFNVGLDDANLSKLQLAEKIREHMPNFYIHAAPVGSDPDKRDYIVSNQRLREAGFVARRSLDEGIRELLVGFRMLGRGLLRNV
ncbi:MAG: NAD(P)-dependent oxidoreductase [Gemmataceae bacterium]|nr:NAD(P)-dependent oxidoreductase [Gemmataceae bacterium]MDW8264924.1 NAD(P)-dependent oxidoreductase [Gemmataceae bacterium]